MSNDLKKVDEIALTCPKCGGDIICPTYRRTKSRPIASVGLSVIFENPDYEPPDDWLPDEIKCKLCKTIYSA